MIKNDEEKIKYWLYLYEHCREISAPLGITTMDIALALDKQGIEPSMKNIEKIAGYLRSTARACVQAWLQDEEDWKFWLEEEK